MSKRIYIVERRLNAYDPKPQLLEDEFDSLREAIDWATDNALVYTGYEHRVLYFQMEEVLTIPVLEEYV